MVSLLNQFWLPLADQSFAVENLPRFFFIDLNKILGYNQIIRPLESLVKQLMPYMQTVSFVILVTAFVRHNVEGEVHGRESRKFFDGLLRSIVIIAIIFMAPKLGEMMDSMVKGLLAAPMKVTSADGGQITDRFGPDPDKAIAGIGKLLGDVVDPASYAAFGAKAQADQAARQQQGQQQAQNAGNSLQHWWDNQMKAIGDALKNNVPGVKYVAEAYSMAKNFGWTVFYWMTKLVQTVAGLIIYVGYAIQRMMLLAMSLYFPIAMSQMASRTLRSQAVGFLLLYIGVFCWPLGWAIINMIVLLILGSFPQASAVSLEDLIRMFFMFCPLCVGIFIGYIIGPFFVQKIISRGGTAIQSFAGQVVAGIGKSAAAGSTAVLSTGLAGLAAALSLGGLIANRLGSGGLQPSSESPYGMGPGTGAGPAVRAASSGVGLDPGNGFGESSRQSLPSQAASSTGTGAGASGRFGVSARALARVSDMILAGTAAAKMHVVAGDTFEMLGRNMAEASGDRIEGYQLSTPGSFGSPGGRDSGRRTSASHRFLSKVNAKVRGERADSSERARQYL
jgi:hypothetical protein